MKKSSQITDIGTPQFDKVSADIASEKRYSLIDIGVLWWSYAEVNRKEPREVEYLQRLAKINEIKIGENENKPSQSATSVIKGLELFMPLANLIDIEKEIQRLDKQIQDMKGRLSAVNNKLKNKNFVSRAPKDVIKHEKEKQKNYEFDLSKLEKNMDALQA